MTPLSLVAGAEQAEVRQEESSWISQVNTGRKMCDSGREMYEAGEKMIAKALRARLKEVGEEQWLAECEQIWGWARSTAYRHKDPEGMERQRQRDAIRRLGNRDAVRRQEPERESPLPPEAEQQAEEMRADEPDDEAQVELAREMVWAGFRAMEKNGEKEQAALVEARDFTLGKLRAAALVS